ncbi:response regulator transcription factor [Coraliomargarita sp. SDUM461004]|uniref:Response regulator transcription factor n=1 Tax=Thalassobacterium sedimentorum TaxID=3041258 RepID=A0ABU1AFN8_9BACT|nr:response regulator transcription factor [Coraliomargarita sp. SDUM461004]MDQ8193369.1 response regulator transcription factor [Coraliomargarita sp. SDUM461004]
MHTVYIIEDEEILQNLLSTFLETVLPDIQLLGMTGDGREGIEQCLKLRPDLAIVDIHLAEISGLEILQQLKSKLPQTKILIFSGNTAHQSIKIAVQSKADGFINKISGLAELEKAIQAVTRGEQYFSPEIYDQVVRIREAKRTGPRSPSL